MPETYTCPNCQAKLRTGNPIKPGRVVPCPKCTQSFVPVPEDLPAEEAEAGAGVFKLVDEPKPKAKKPTAKAPAPEPPPTKKPVDDDEEDSASVRRGYGVQNESEEELARLEANKPKFGDVADKFAKSARGPAMAMLVQPANLLIFEGFITCVAAIALFVFGMWPLVFSDAPPGDEETEEAVMMMLGGLMVFGWGAIICVGASQLTSLESYTWAMVGSVMGILPLMAGIYALALLRNPKVIAGFEEVDIDDADVKAKDEDEDEEDEEEEPPPRKRKG